MMINHSQKYYLPSLNRNRNDLSKKKEKVGTALWINWEIWWMIVQGLKMSNVCSMYNVLYLVFLHSNWNAIGKSSIQCF